MTINIDNCCINRNACIFVWECTQESALESMFLRLSKYIWVISYKFKYTTLKHSTIHKVMYQFILREFDI